MKSLLTLLLLPGFLLAQSPNTCDLVITNGKIIDGTGNSWYRGTLIVNQGKIVSIIRQPSTQKWENSWAPLQVIDAKDKIVAPGFIDVHTHIEGDEKKDPEAKSFIYDGVTTCITGNCGLLQVDAKKYFDFKSFIKVLERNGLIYQFSENDREKIDVSDQYKSDVVKFISDGSMSQSIQNIINKLKEITEQK